MTLIINRNMSSEENKNNLKDFNERELTHDEEKEVNSKIENGTILTETLPDGMIRLKR